MHETTRAADGADADAAAPPGRARLPASALLTVSMTAALNVVCAISFAALIFQGNLAGYLGGGAGLILAGSFVLGIAGAFGASQRGAVILVADMPVIILSLGAAAIAANWSAEAGTDLFATIAALMATTSLAVGATFLALGRFRLGALARYLPYPVLGGFLAATGFFLVLGAAAAMTGRSADPLALAPLLTGEDWARWVPGMLFGLGLFAVSRVMGGWQAMPAGLAVGFAGFFGGLHALGVELETAAEMGLLLGPFEGEGFAAALDPGRLLRADWGAVAGQGSVIVTAVAMCAVGLLLNASAVEMATGARADMNRDLGGVGLANLLAGAAGGAPGYHVIGESLMLRQLGLADRRVAAATAAGCGLALLVGAQAISVLPMGVFGGLIAFFGFDLLHRWLWRERRRLPPADFGVVLAILLAAAVFGFLEGVAVGILASLGLFVFAYARTPILRHVFDGAMRASTTDRSPEEREVLDRHGRETRVYELEGFLFFGTVVKLSRVVGEDAARGDPPLRRVILDFHRVKGIDTSAVYSLGRLAADCAEAGVQVAFSGLDREDWARRSAGVAPLGADRVRLRDSLDAALAWAEEACLDQHLPERRPDESRLADMFGEVLDAEGRARLEAYFERERAPAGTPVIRTGEQGRDMYFLERGRLVIEVVLPDGSRLRLGEKLPGTLVGEMALYAQAPRSADVIAGEDCTLLRLSQDALERMEGEDPALAIRFHREAALQLSARLGRANQLIHALSR